VGHSRYTFHVYLIGPELSVGDFTCAPCSAAVGGRYMQAMHCIAHTSSSIRAFGPRDRNGTVIDLKSRDRAQLPTCLVRSVEGIIINQQHCTQGHIAILCASKRPKPAPETMGRSVLPGFYTCNLCPIGIPAIQQDSALYGVFSRRSI